MMTVLELKLCLAFLRNLGDIGLAFRSAGAHLTKKCDVTYKHNHAGRSRFVFFTLGEEQNTLAGFLSPRGIVMCQLWLFTTKIACKGFRLDSLATKPEVVLLVSFE